MHQKEIRNERINFIKMEKYAVAWDILKGIAWCLNDMDWHGYFAKVADMTNKLFLRSVSSLYLGSVRCSNKAGLELIHGAHIHKHCRHRSMIGRGVRRIRPVNLQGDDKVPVPQGLVVHGRGHCGADIIVHQQERVIEAIAYG